MEVLRPQANKSPGHSGNRKSHMPRVQTMWRRAGLDETGNVGKGEILYSLADSVVNLRVRPGLESKSSRNH